MDLLGASMGHVEAAVIDGGLGSLVSQILRPFRRIEVPVSRQHGVWEYDGIGRHGSSIVWVPDGYGSWPWQVVSGCGGLLDKGSGQQCGVRRRWCSA